MLFAWSMSNSSCIAARQLGSCSAAWTDEGMGDVAVDSVGSAYLGLGLNTLACARVTIWWAGAGEADEAEVGDEAGVATTFDAGDGAALGEPGDIVASWDDGEA